MAQAGERTLRTGTGAYRVFDLVAAGAFGGVYYGRNLADGSPVAIKLLHEHYAGSPNVVVQFEREAPLVRQLEHPNVVRVLDHGRDETGLPFIVMEWVTGWTLDTLIRQAGAPRPGRVAEMGCQVLDGLEAARLYGLVHLDIKPKNLMLTAEGRVKVMDFGIARATELAAVTGSSVVLGTPAYMAPEQFTGQPLDSRADLYALGITLYQLLVGHTPFQSTTTAGYMYQHLEEPPPPLASALPTIDPGLAAIVQRALEKRPADRYQTPAEMRALLRHFARPQPVLHADSTPRVGERMLVPISRPARLDPQPSPRPGRPRRRGLLALVALLGLASVLGGTLMVLQPSLDVPFSRELPRPLDLPFSIAWPTAGGPTAAEAPTAESPAVGPPTLEPATLAPPTVAPPTPGPPTPDARAAVAACQAGLREAEALMQRQAWAQAIVTLETIRSPGCDVASPLYSAHLGHGLALAQDERTSDAIAAFDRALQTRSGGSDAVRERELAVAYRAGREAIERKDWPRAVEQLATVHQGRPGYARGNVVGHLANAHLGQGDELLGQDRPADAQRAYERAAALKPDDAGLLERIAKAKAAAEPAELTVRIVRPINGARVGQSVVIEGIRQGPWDPAAQHLWLLVGPRQGPPNLWAHPDEIVPDADGRWQAETYFGGEAGLFHRMVVGAVDGAGHEVITRHLAEKPGDPFEGGPPPGFRTLAEISIEHAP